MVDEDMSIRECGVMGQQSRAWNGDFNEDEGFFSEQLVTGCITATTMPQEIETRSENYMFKSCWHNSTS
jgi:hypothetical protein